ncbi:DNA polymerase III subunit alpha [Deinococcus altitudinis]|uniref:DNA polymerase III subunit alpha n=1 Tax=Deinococcus altitudinis TaxID=468914 RepID=UPI0038929EE8
MAAPNRLTSLLDSHSFFSEGASTVSPVRLVKLAEGRGFTGLALTDDASVGGAVDLCQNADEANFRTVIGTTLPVLAPRLGASAAFDVFPFLLLAQDRIGYARINVLLSKLMRGEQAGLPLGDLLAETGGLVLLTGGRRGFPTVLGAERKLEHLAALLNRLKRAFPSRLYVQLYHDAYPGMRRTLGFLRALARDHGLPCVAAPEIRLASPDEYPLLDALTCARLGIDVNVPHPDRPRNDASHLRTPEEWGRLLPYADALLNAEKLAQKCHLDLRPERLTPPMPELPKGLTAREYLRKRAEGGLLAFYTPKARPAARARLEAELGTVEEMQLEGFFLSAAEVTDYCSEHGILAAGRGSAAGSVLCYVLGITLADPIKHNLLFERFLHTGRRTMPDVDIDIASSRRDQVLAWVEQRWGADGTGEAMVANRITYRLPSAVQDLGRALGMPPELRDRLSRSLGRDHRHARPHQALEAAEVFTEVLGKAPVRRQLLKLLTLFDKKFFRHHAPHSGGVILSARPLTHYSPLVRSSGGIRMLTFDKDDIEHLGLIKLDLLGLRMLGVLERAREDVTRLTGKWLDFGNLSDDPQVWQRLRLGDTMALFQIESPAQTIMTARLQPENMTDLAHQIALVRPGPIQSGTVHPYVRRRLGEEPIPTLREPLQSILRPSLNVLLFQEQILRLAVHYAGMDWVAADRFRKDVSSVEEAGEMEQLRRRFLDGAARTCQAPEQEAAEVFGWCAAFRGYGFAESHAWAFAQHSYASAYLRHHFPAPYLAAFLTESPGMWPAHTIVLEAKRWGVQLLPLSLNRSEVTYRAESTTQVRIALTAVDGISEHAARQIVLERHLGGPFKSIEAAYDRLALSTDQHESLAKAGAYGDQARREALFTLTKLANARPGGKQGLLAPTSEAPELDALSPDELLHLDLSLTGVTASGRDLLDGQRSHLRDLGCVPLGNVRHGGSVWIAGSIVSRQKPPTARGFAFFILQDGSARIQIIISPDLWEAHRQLLRDAWGLIVYGTVTVQGRAVTLKVERLIDLPLIRRNTSPAQQHGYG